MRFVYTCLNINHSIIKEVREVKDGCYLRGAKFKNIKVWPESEHLMKNIMKCVTMCNEMSQNVMFPECKIPKYKMCESKVCMIICTDYKIIYIVCNQCA